MKELIVKFLSSFSKNEVWQNICQDEFICGIIFGIGVYLILILLVHLIFIICRSRKCKMVVIRTDNGNINVSLKAVTGVLISKLAVFNQIEIDKVTIFQKRSGYVMELRGKFMPGQSGTPELFEKIVAMVKLQMQDIFGVTNITKVNLLISESVMTSEPVERKENTADNTVDLM